MTQYIYLVAAGIVLGIITILFNDDINTIKSRIFVATGVSGAGLFIYGTIVSVTDILAKG